MFAASDLSVRAKHQLPLHAQSHTALAGTAGQITLTPHQKNLQKAFFTGLEVVTVVFLK
jgi:hypothetical protein